jgi:putative ABC transport system substrate-binding protein
MHRRESITVLLGGAAAAWPRAARTQQRQAMPVVGWLSPRDRQTEEEVTLARFRQGMSQQGFADGRDFIFDFRFAHGHYDLIPALAEELVRRRVDVIVAITSTVSGRAAQSATRTIPIVFVSGTDPVEAGLVPNLNRPSGNITGVVTSQSDLASKQIGLLRELLPNAATIAVLTNPANPGALDVWAKDAQAAGANLRRRILALSASAEREIDVAFDRVVEQRADALMISPDPFLNSRIGQIVALAARHAVPTMYSRREHALTGGLVSYGAKLDDMYRIMGSYVGRILKGEKPGDLPVQQPTKFEFVLNLKTAKALGIEVPPTLSALADEIIE